MTTMTFNIFSQCVTLIQPRHAKLLLFPINRIISMTGRNPLQHTNFSQIFLFYNYSSNVLIDPRSCLHTASNCVPVISIAWEPFLPSEQNTPSPQVVD